MPEKKPSSKKISETRKLVKWGSSKTLIMSLPRSWTKKHSLTEQNEVQVYENPDGSLLILPLIKDEFENTIQSSVIESEKYPDWEAFSYVVTTKVLDGNDMIEMMMGRHLRIMVHDEAIGTVASHPHFLA